MSDLSKLSNEELQKLGDVIEEALNLYRCQNSRDEDNDGLGLADILTAPGEQDVSTGQDEIRLLADYILTDIADFMRRLTPPADNALLDELDALEAKATPAPWRLEKLDMCVCGYENGNQDYVIANLNLHYHNGRLIVLLRNSLPAFRAHIAALEAENKRLRELCKRAESEE